MSNAARLIAAYPGTMSVDRDLLATAIDAALACSQTCTACADACLSEEMVAEMATCVRTDLDCADICGTTARILSRHTGYDANITRRSSRPASRPAAAVATSASSMRRCTRTAGCAPRRAAPASRPARRHLLIPRRVSGAGARAG